MNMSGFKSYVQGYVEFKVSITLVKARVCN